jgi:putative transcriptional regulator
MAIKFYKLMDLLNRKGMSKGELQALTGISSATMAKVSANKAVSLEVIDKICKALDCQPGDIMEYIPEE